MKNRWNLQIAEQLMSDQSASGQSKQDFCADRKINPATFYYWQKRLRESESPGVGFTPIKVSVTKTIEIQLASGQWLAVRSSDVDMLAEVLIKIRIADA
jgi:hypothetical protein